jgi:hypothetical protein
VLQNGTHSTIAEIAAAEKIDDAYWVAFSG